MDPVNGIPSRDSDDVGGVTAGGSDPSDVAGRPRWTLLLVAGFVVMVVGGFALSRDYGVQSIPALPDLEEVAAPSSSSTSRSTTTTLGASALIDPGPLDWMNDLVDVAITSDGLVYVAAPAGVAWRGSVGDWVLVDLEGLPVGTGSDDGYPGRTISQIVAGPDDSLWATGYATSHADDVEFGGSVDGWTGGRVLEWVARYHCPVCGEWTVWTSDEVPELGNGIGDLVVSSEGIVYASVGEDQLAVFDGQTWESHTAPIPTDSGGVAYPWSGSLAVGTDGVVWAGTNYHGWGVLAFDGTGFTRYTTRDGLPEGYIHHVTATGDGTIWAQSDGSGAARFDGAGWTIGPSELSVGGFATEVAPDGTLWTISDEGLVSFDGITRTIHPSPFAALTPVDWWIHAADAQAWGIDPGDAQWDSNVYSVHTIVDVRPLTVDLVEGVSGRLIWDETVVDLCGIDIRHVGDGFLHVGDIFETFEGCGRNPTAMQDAFNEFGLPETACVTVAVDGLDHEYCAPLPAVEDSAWSESGTVAVSLDGLQGFEGLVVDAWLLPLEPTGEKIAFGGISLGIIYEDPYSGADVMHPPSDRYFDVIPGEVATFEPGAYRFIIEAYEPLGAMYYGCEKQVQVVEGDSTVVSFTSLPSYPGDGWLWTPYDQLEYPDCP